MSNQALEVPTKAVSAVRNGAISFSGQLDSGEKLTGTPTVVASGLTISNALVSVAALEINGKTVPAGEAVQFKVTGGAAGQRYTLVATCGTDSTPAQTLVGGALLDVVADGS